MRTDFLFYPLLQKQKTHTNLGMIWALSHRGDISILYEVEGAEERHQMKWYWGCLRLRFETGSCYVVSLGLDFRDHPSHHTQTADVPLVT